MQRVLINMQNFLFGDAIAETLQKEATDLEVMKAEESEQVTEIGRWYVPNVLLLEVTSYAPWRLEERLSICREIKQQNPYCKTVLSVDEKAEKELARRVLQAKRDGLIDNFIYNSISSTYLSAVIGSL